MTDESASKTTPVIDCSGVHFAYGNFSVLENVNLQIFPLDFVCIVGPNGGGKTTLLKLILGLLSPSRGAIRVFGEPPGENRRIGYMTQHAQLDSQFPVRVLDVVLMGCLGTGHRMGFFHPHDRQRALSALDQVGLKDLAHRPLSALSGGQRQRVLIARALACQPDILLLDEPTASLDLAVENQLYELLKRLNQRMTIVMVSHDLGFVSQFINRVVCVKHRVVVHPTGVITQDMINEIYGTDMRIVRHNHQCATGEHA